MATHQCVAFDQNRKSRDDSLHIHWTLMRCDMTRIIVPTCARRTVLLLAIVITSTEAKLKR